MQINAITGTNKDVWREEGRGEEGEARKEGGERREKGERKGKSHSWPVAASLYASHLLASQSIFHDQQFLAILSLPLYSLLP